MIEVYGIAHGERMRCGSCDLVTKELKARSVEYVFKEVMREVDTELGFEYDRAIIDELRHRLKKPTGSLAIPTVFVNGILIGGAKDLLNHLDQLDN